MHAVSYTHLDVYKRQTYSGVLSIADHGKHTVSARAIANVGRISRTARKTALVDKVAPVISCLLYTSRCV